MQICLEYQYVFDFSANTTNEQSEGRTTRTELNSLRVRKLLFFHILADYQQTVQQQNERLEAQIVKIRVSRTDLVLLYCSQLFLGG